MCRKSSRMSEQIRIILVEPTHPGNIGAVARSIKTMGLSRLVLVNPKKFPHPEASQRAAGAESVLDEALVVDSVDQAVADCTLVLGTSVRDREVTWPTFDPRETAKAVYTHSQNSSHQVAILFGRESSGLTNSELDLCQSQIRIPANSEYSSLNLACAVQIIAYEIRMQRLLMQASEASIGLEKPTQSNREEKESGVKERQQVANKKQRDGHIQHLQSTLETLDFIKAKPPTTLMRKLTRLYNKANLTIEEIQILRGILTAVESRVKTNTKAEQ